MVVCDSKCDDVVAQGQSKSGRCWTTGPRCCSWPCWWLCSLSWSPLLRRRQVAHGLSLSSTWGYASRPTQSRHSPGGWCRTDVYIAGVRFGPV